MSRSDIVERGSVGDWDNGLKNKWRWNWLERKHEDVEFGQYIDKLKAPGKAYCKLCRLELTYKSAGARILADHMKSQGHQKLHAQQKKNHHLPVSFGTTGPAFGKKLHPFFLPRTTQSPSSTDAGPSTSEDPPTHNPPPPPPVRPIVPISDRVHHQEATVLGFMTENSLSLSMAPRLVTLTKELARDPSALSKLSMGRTSATYKATYGLAKTFKEDMVDDIGDQFFSLNLDEATSSNNEKVLTVLISFFSERWGRVVVQHLGSTGLLRATSISVVQALDKMLADSNLKWSRCLAMLMDSCNVMRGVKTGVEKTVREEKAPHLLDIDGDSCHHVHIACKAFTSVFGGAVEKLFGDIFTDFENKQFQDCLSLICFTLDVKYTRPERFLQHRWLSALNLSADTLRLFDCLTVLYYEFLPKMEKTAYHATVTNILCFKKVNEAARDEIRNVRKELGTIGMTSVGKERKQRIVGRLFYHRDDTLLQLKLFMDSLALLKEFVMLFQSIAPLIHVLHDQQLSMMRQYLLYFVKPECMKPLKTETLLKLDLDDTSNHLDLDAVFLGKAELHLQKLSPEIQRSFRETAVKGYIACGKVLLRKLPLSNGFLQAAGGLNPDEKSSVALAKCLKLTSFLPADVLASPCEPSEDEDSEDAIQKNEATQAAYSKEVRSFLGEDNIPALKEDQRVDEWWADIFSKYPLPLLSKVVKAVLSIFHGPVVESSFNIMADIIDQRSGRMNMATFDAYHTTRFSIMASGKTACSLFRRANVLRDPLNKRLITNMATASQEYYKGLSEKKAAKQRRAALFDKRDARVASKRKAIETLREEAKKARLTHLKKACKK